MIIVWSFCSLWQAMVFCFCLDWPLAAVASRVSLCCSTSNYQHECHLQCVSKRPGRLELWSFVGSVFQYIEWTEFEGFVPLASQWNIYLAHRVTFLTKKKKKVLVEVIKLFTKWAYFKTMLNTFWNFQMTGQ